MSSQWQSFHASLMTAIARIPLSHQAATCSIVILQIGGHLQGLAFAMLYKEASPALGTSVCEQHRLYVGLLQPEGCPMQPVELVCQKSDRAPSFRARCEFQTLRGF